MWKIAKNVFKITKSDDDRMLAFGWANVSIRTDGEKIVDWQEDMIDLEGYERFSNPKGV